MVSIIVPVLNEEEAVANTLREITYFLQNKLNYEIIVVNDGSTDQTVQKINESNIANIRIISHLENLGYGKSLYDGILAAKYECIAIIDGDGSYPVNRIMDLYSYYPRYDMVVGARSGEEYRRGVFKRPARALFNYLVEYAAGRKVPDVNSGLRIFKKDIVLKYKDSLCTGFSFTTTLTLIFLLNHYFVKYVPIEYLKRKGRSKVHHFRETLRAGQIIIEAILSYNPIKLFLLISITNSIFGLSLFILNAIFVNSIFITIIAAICVASFIPVFCFGLLAAQIKRR